MIWNIIKRIPTPEYGHYGGYYNRARSESKPDHPDPIDVMDSAFHSHDHGKNNSWLVGRLRGIKDNELKHKVYGPLYRRGAILVFKIALLFGVE